MLLPFLTYWYMLISSFYICLSGVYSHSFGYRLDVYIYDYLLKKKLYASARSFLAEGKVFLEPVGTNVLWITVI